MRLHLSAILLLGAILLLPGCGRQAPEYRIVSAEGDWVNISLPALNDGNVHFFTYKCEGRNVNFFIRTDGGGRLRAHFDACYSCFKYKLGYVRRDNQVVCIACQIGYDLDDIHWEYVGACAPINLSSRSRGGYLSIRRALLEKGKKFF